MNGFRLQHLISIPEPQRGVPRDRPPRRSRDAINAAARARYAARPEVAVRRAKRESPEYKEELRLRKRASERRSLARNPDRGRKRREYNKLWAKRNPQKVARDNRAWRMRSGRLPFPTREAPETCECCGRTKQENGKGLSLDHCHHTGAFRGWLCWHCNTALGKLGDSLEGVLRAVAYLQRAREMEDDWIT